MNYARRIRSSRESIPTVEALRSLLAELDPFTADVALAIFAQLGRPSASPRPKFPLLEGVILTTEALQRYPGIRKFNGKPGQPSRRLHDEVERLRNLRFRLDQCPPWEPPAGKPRSWVRIAKGYQLFDIVRYQSTNSGPQAAADQAWLARAGQWAYWWMNGDGRLWIARMSRLLLDLNHRDKRSAADLAQKIGQHLMLERGLHCAGWPRRKRILIPVRRVLEAVDELPPPKDQAPHLGIRLHEKFALAAAALTNVNVVCAVHWPEGYGPEDSVWREEEQWRWLSAKIQVTREDAPSELLPKEFGRLRMVPIPEMPSDPFPVLKHPEAIH